MTKGRLGSFLIKIAALSWKSLMLCLPLAFKNGNGQLIYQPTLFFNDYTCMQKQVHLTTPCKVGGNAMHHFQMLCILLLKVKKKEKE